MKYTKVYLRGRKKLRNFLFQSTFNIDIDSRLKPLRISVSFLEKGAFEVPPFDLDAKSMQLSANQLHFILQGISLQTIKYRKRYQQGSAK